MDVLKDWVLNNMLTVVVSVIAVVGAKYIGKLIDIIEDKFHIDIDDRIEETIGEFVKKAVQSTYQAFVSVKKAEGSWDGDIKKEALNIALKQVLSDVERTDLVSYIKGRNLVDDIEAAILNEKNQNMI